jgi:chromate reductase, NAD(P)H dehydrogenase (quinone)
MSATIHIVGFTGSLREKSYNLAALRAAQELLPTGAELEIVSLGNLPLYNQDLEQDEPETVRSFKEKIREADALLIVTPEYNFSIPGVLKNAIDWASRPAGKSVLRNKPTAIMGVGGRMGTARAQQHLRQILEHLRADIVDKPEVYVANGWEKFDSNGNLTDEQTRQQIRTLLETLVQEVEMPELAIAS